MASIRTVFHLCPVGFNDEDERTRPPPPPPPGDDTTDAADWLEYGASELQNRNTRRRLEARYNVQAEFLQPAGWISRTPEGKFVVTDDELGARQIHPTHIYYSPATSPVVESGVYRIGGDRLVWPRPQPILRRELSPVPPHLIDQSTLPPRSRPLSPNPDLVSPQFGRHSIPSQQPLPGNRSIIRSSSPGPGLLFSPSLANFSDMSSVRHPGSAERSLQTSTFSSQRLSSFQKQPATSPTPDLPPRRRSQLRPNVNAGPPVLPSDYYIHELPALLPIHQQLVADQQSPTRSSRSPTLPQMRTVRAEVHSTETPRSGVGSVGGGHSNQRVQSQFGLLLNTTGRHLHAPPPFRPPPPPVYLPYTISYPSSSLQRPLATSSPPRSRHFPTTTAAPFSSGPPLGSPRRRSPLTIAVRLSPSRTQQRLSERSRSQIVEYSPQSQSSSSGFDSKNTSQQNQSSQSGSGQSQMVVDSSSSSLWAGAVPSAESTYVNWPVKPPVATGPAISLLDASVDNHYEFDTTQSPNETGGQDPTPTTLSTPTFVPSARAVILATDSSGPGPGRHRKTGSAAPVRSENIEARVQAMKEEFQEYRKRRARGLLESAC